VIYALQKAGPKLPYDKLSKSVGPYVPQKSWCVFMWVGGGLTGCSACAASLDDSSSLLLPRDDVLLKGSNSYLFGVWKAGGVLRICKKDRSPPRAGEMSSVRNWSILTLND
jgi:hypothetical protein